MTVIILVKPSGAEKRSAGGLGSSLTILGEGPGWAALGVLCQRHAQVDGVGPWASGFASSRLLCCFSTVRDNEKNTFVQGSPFRQTLGGGSMSICRAGGGA